MRQQPKRSILLTTEKEEYGLFSKGLGKGDNLIQIQVSDLEDWLVILNLHQNKLHFLSLGLFNPTNEEDEEEKLSNYSKKIGQQFKINTLDLNVAVPDGVDISSVIIFRETAYLCSTKNDFYEIPECS